MSIFPSAATMPAVLLSFLALGACSPKSDSTADSVAAASPGSTSPSPDTMSAMDHGQMSGMANMTGDPDRDFLRMMSDHHKGLTGMAHLALEKKGSLAVRSDASKMDKAQDAELDRIVSMLDKQYKDAYTPSVMPDNQRMIDELKGKSGADFSRNFLRNVIAHHRQAVQMVDEYLPRAKSPQVKAMAEKMKSDQTREIAELQRKLNAL